jgi:hypothetical protein
MGYLWMKDSKMNIKRIKQRTKLRAQYEVKDMLSTKIFSTKHNTYTVGDMITLTSCMVILTLFAYVSLMVGIPK